MSFGPAQALGVASSTNRHLNRHWRRSSPRPLQATAAAAEMTPLTDDSESERRPAGTSLVLGSFSGAASRAEVENVCGRLGLGELLREFWRREFDANPELMSPNELGDENTISRVRFDTEPHRKQNMTPLEGGRRRVSSTATARSVTTTTTTRKTQIAKRRSSSCFVLQKPTSGVGRHRICSRSSLWSAQLLLLLALLPIVVPMVGRTLAAADAANEQHQQQPAPARSRPPRQTAPFMEMMMNANGPIEGECGGRNLILEFVCPVQCLSWRWRVLRRLLGMCLARVAAAGRSE